MKTKTDKMKTAIKATLFAASLAVAPLAMSGGNEQYNTDEKLKDAWLDGKAETTLLVNGNLNSFKIDTDVKNGVVILTGEVESEVDKALAEELVESLDGVKDVENKLIVKRDHNMDSDHTMDTDHDSDDGEVMETLKDSKIATVVKTRLLFESEVSGTNIDVEVDKGVVVLKGKVKTDAERDLALAIAKNTNDVKKVVDNLTIGK